MDNNHLNLWLGGLLGGGLDSLQPRNSLFGILGGQQPKNYLGYPVRQPHPSELSFFAGSNPKVTGMATEDNKITFNPAHGLTGPELNSVGMNEAYRLLMRELNFNPQFHVTDQQRQSFLGGPYENNPDAMRQTILSRILSGDPSAGEQTFEQNTLANTLRNIGLWR